MRQNCQFPVLACPSSKKLFVFQQVLVCNKLQELNLLHKLQHLKLLQGIKTVKLFKALDNA